MPLRKLIEQSINQRRSSSFLTMTNVALAVMLVSILLVVRFEMAATYDRQVKGYGFVLGRGSAFDLMMTSVFHIRESSNTIPYALYEEFAGEKGRPMVRAAVPYALGDSYGGHRIVATTSEFFSEHFPQPPGKGQEKLLVGRPFRWSPEAVEALACEAGHDHDHDHEHHHESGEAIFEAVVGWEAARDLDLRVGSTFQASHGHEDGHSHENVWTVVGILKRSGTAIDRIITINLDSFYRIGDHQGSLGAVGPQITSLLLFPRTGRPALLLLQNLRRRNDCDYALVSETKQRMRQLLGNVDKVLLVLAITVVVIGIKGILVALLNTMNERRRELAILRAIGARRSTLVLSIVGESTLLTLGGATLGLLLGHLALWLLRGPIQAETRLVIDPLKVLPEELLMVAAVTLTGAIAGLIPALKAYRNDVARNLAPLS